MIAGAQTFILNQTILSLSGDAWIEDDQGSRRYEVDGKAFRLRRTLELRDAGGRLVHTINRSLTHIRLTFEIKDASDSVVATIEKALWSFPGDRFSVNLVNGGELEIAGDIIDREFRVTSGGIDVIAVTRSLVTVHDAYRADIAPGFDVALGLAIVVAVEQMELMQRKDDGVPAIGIRLS
jgi:uncharacterized protein YxjI